jgi:hypothetical protein
MDLLSSLYSQVDCSQLARLLAAKRLRGFRGIANLVPSQLASMRALPFGSSRPSALSLLYIPAAFGHAYVQAIIAGSQNITTYLPFHDPYQRPPPSRITRPFANNSPVQDVNDDIVTCNFQSDKSPSSTQPAALHASVAAGGELSFEWSPYPDSHKGKGNGFNL